MQLHRMCFEVIHNNDLDLPKGHAQRTREIIGGAIENSLNIAIARCSVDQHCVRLVRQTYSYLSIPIQTSLQQLIPVHEMIANDSPCLRRRVYYQHDRNHDQNARPDIAIVRHFCVPFHHLPAQVILQ